MLRTEPRRRFSYPGQLERQQAVDDTAACMQWASAEHGPVKTGMIGFSAGGHLAYLAACLLPIDRTAVLYGGWLTVTDIPLSRPTPTLDRQDAWGRILALLADPGPAEPGPADPGNTGQG